MRVPTFFVSLFLFLCFLGSLFMDFSHAEAHFRGNYKVQTQEARVEKFRSLLPIGDLNWWFGGGGVPHLPITRKGSIPQTSKPLNCNLKTRLIE